MLSEIMAGLLFSYRSCIIMPVIQGFGKIIIPSCLSFGSASALKKKVVYNYVTTWYLHNSVAGTLL